ncbi:MAG: MoxR family ATPase [Oscillospiraceae bacterium]|jgi:MoxR-like ATPase|nr:MoxR family ATPase [Oscillospiraceae bacterium]
MKSSITEVIQSLKESIHTAIVGKDDILELFLVALLCEGHLLIEDVPGVGKTSFVSALAAAAGCSFRRIQFTPDVMPGDITGFTMPDLKTGEFVYKEGMLMSQIVLADEINRATSKTQSALLEAMEEKQISVDGTTHPLPRPFMVLATQNPNENIGTYKLPESQIDRFMMKISIGYPNPAEEFEILNRYVGADPRNSVPQVITSKIVVQMQEYTSHIYTADAIKEYIINIVNQSRQSPFLQYGVSPRGSLALIRAAQAAAVLEGSTYVTPRNVQRIASPVLSHRLVLTPSAQAEGVRPEDLVQQFIAAVPVPLGKSVG